MLSVGPIALRAQSNGTNLVEVADYKGNMRVSLGVTPGGDPGFALLGPDGKPLVRVQVTAGSASIVLSDKEGKVLWQAPTK